MKVHRIVGFGEVLWDIFGQEKKLGGAPANFTYHADRDGIEAYIISAVGQDEEGQELLTRLKEKAVKTDYVEMVDAPTGQVSVSLDTAGVASYEIHENCAWDVIPWQEKLAELAKKTDAICFGSLCQRSRVTRETLLKYLDHLHPSCMKVFDLNLRQNYFNKELVEKSLQACNILKINDEEALVLGQLVGLLDEESAKEWRVEAGEELYQALLERYDLHMIIITLGSEGSRIYTKNQKYAYKGEPVEVVDTVGAGDSFLATFIACLLEGKDILLSLQQATERASYVCTQQGAMPPLN